MRACLDLLVKYNYLNKEGKTLREIYEDAIGVYKIERNDPSMWKLLNNHEVQNLFQMEQDSGIKGIAAVHPNSIDDLTALNAVIRLMAPEKGAEQPVDKFARFKKNYPQAWHEELIQWKVDKKYWDILENIIGISYGMCIQQEQFMMLVQQPEIGGFSLLWADRLRKSIAKKNAKDYEQLEKEFYEITSEKGCDANLCRYVWDNLIALNRGYGFNAAHTLGYSIIALQELNLAWKESIIFWNTANLIVDSGAMNLEEDFVDKDEEEKDEENEENSENCVDEFEEENVSEEEENPKKVKNSSTDYGRIAAAIGRMKARGLQFDLPNINKSDLTFTPIVESNKILYGIRGITRIGNSIIKEIFKNRPYTSIEDFLSKVKVNKTQMVSLIKAGVFDSLYENHRESVMKHYLNLVADKKKRITLQNMNMLIEKKMIPEELDYERRLFNFNRYIKTLKDGTDYLLDAKAFRFFTERNSEDLLEEVIVDGDNISARIKINKWDNIYKKDMEPVRVWMKTNQQQILDDLNSCLYNEIAEKYAAGTISKWEMDSLSFYYHEHELAALKNDAYGIVDFFNLPEEPVIDRTFTTKDGSTITMFEINRIAGTVIDKDKNKSTVTLLTTTGVVTVKVWKNQFAKWDKQISARGSDGKKHVIEKSFFQRGNKLIITGIRRGDNFIPKKYKSTELPLFEKIEEMENGYITQSSIERADVEE